jgi:type II secretory pathway pseudopilin PulG
MRQPAKKTAPSGFTVIELILIVSIIGILAGMAGPAISTIVRHSRTNRAGFVITADLQNAFAVAARQRQPVQIVADSASKSYQFIDRKTGTVLKVRSFYGDVSEYQLQKLIFTPTTIDVFPSGVSSAPLTVDLGNGDYSRRITASTAGFIRLVPR